MKKNKFQFLSIILTFSLLLNIISYVPAKAFDGGNQSSTSKQIQINKEDKEIIKTEIEDFKKMYVNENMQAIAPLALNKAGASQELLDNAYFKTGTSSIIYSQNILSLIGGNKNPREYKGTDYIKKLVQSQRPAGDEFEGQFIVGNIIDPNSPINLAYSIIALEVAKADYNKELAITALTKLVLNEKIVSSVYNDIEVKGMALIALASHPEVEGDRKSVV